MVNRNFNCIFQEKMTCIYCFPCNFILKTVTQITKGKDVGLFTETNDFTRLYSALTYSFQQNKRHLGCHHHTQEITDHLLT